MEDQEYTPMPGVYSLDNELRRVPALDPLHFSYARAGAGLGRLFAKLLLRFDPNASIGLIPCAFGGAAVRALGAGGFLFDNDVRRPKAAMKSGKLRASEFGRPSVNPTSAVPPSGVTGFPRG